MPVLVYLQWKAQKHSYLVCHISVHTQHIEDHWLSLIEIFLHKPMDILHANLHLFLHDLQQGVL